MTLETALDRLADLDSVEFNEVCDIADRILETAVQFSNSTGGASASDINRALGWALIEWRGSNS
jgi:hypothetical protein